MEHLPLGENANIITVPYIANTTYDDGDFYSYPTRQDYEFWELAKRSDAEGSHGTLAALTRGRTLDNLAAFIQSWLFFGLLRSCVEPKPESKNYVLQSPVITTEHLGRDLLVWKQHVYAKRDIDRAANANTTRDCIDKAIIAVAILDEIASRGAARTSDQEGLNKVWEQLFLCESLISALANAQSKIFGAGHPSTITQTASIIGRMPSWLGNKFRESGWCPHTVSYLKAYFRVDLQMYAYGLGTERSRKDHRKCSVGHCDPVDLENAKTPRHTATCRGCKSVGPPLDDLVRVLSSGQIPIISLGTTSDDDSCLKLQVDRARPEDDYVAISHVWSDGMANSHANELPICQLLELRKTLLQVGSKLSIQYQLKRTLLPVWFDALCIPADEKYQALRNFSINSMFRIYKDALAVLIFDPDLRKLQSNTPPLEIMARTLFCGWSGRLWTFQEGSGRKKEKFLAAANTVFDLDDVMLRGRVAEQSGRPEALQYSFSGTLEQQLFQRVYLDPNYITELGSQQLLAAISHRITSRTEDEPIVIASFLQLDVSPIEAETLREKRMTRLLQSMTWVPRNILFATGPRLNTPSSPPGFAWAPRTLLAPYGVGDHVVDHVVQSRYDDQTVAGAENPTAATTRRGRRRKSESLCLFQAKQAAFKTDVAASLQLCYLHPSPWFGLAAFFPGINIDRPVDVSSGHFTLRTQTNDHFAVRTSGEGRQPRQKSEPPLALILSMISPDGIWSPALLVTVHGTVASDPANPDREFSMARSLQRVTACSFDPRNTKFLLKMPAKASYFKPRWWLVDPV
ncbi:hypothetical protein MBLNU230_g5483t1 [Neophaeotheca triangularis]